MLKAGVPVVIGMQTPLSIGAANEFAEAFYRVLGAGLSLDEAVAAGRMKIMELYKNRGETEEDREEIEEKGTRDQDFGVPVLYATAVSGPLFPELRTARAEEAIQDVCARSGATRGILEDGETELRGTGEGHELTQDQKDDLSFAAAALKHRKKILDELCAG